MGIIDVISILFISIISAFVGFGFNAMLQPDMIFDWYREFLEQLPVVRDRAFPYDSDHKYYKESRILYYLTKPLGICIICNTTWIGMIIAAFYFKPVSNYSLIHVISCIITGVASAGIVIIITNIHRKLQR